MILSVASLYLRTADYLTGQRSEQNVAFVLHHRRWSRQVGHPLLPTWTGQTAHLNVCVFRVSYLCHYSNKHRYNLRPVAALSLTNTDTQTETETQTGRQKDRQRQGQTDRA